MKIPLIDVSLFTNRETVMLSDRSTKRTRYQTQHVMTSIHLSVKIVPCHIVRFPDPLLTTYRKCFLLHFCAYRSHILVARHPDLSKMCFVFGTPSAVNGCNCTPPILFIVIAKSTDPLNMNIPKTVPASRQLHSCEPPAPALTTTTTVEADEARCPVKITVGSKRRRAHLLWSLHF